MKKPDPEHKAKISLACDALREIAPGSAFVIIVAFEEGEDSTTVCTGGNLSADHQHTLMLMAIDGFSPAPDGTSLN